MVRDLRLSNSTVIPITAWTLTVFSDDGEGHGGLVDRTWTQGYSLWLSVCVDAWKRWCWRWLMLDR
jgi:hypothetical protein